MHHPSASSRTLSRPLVILFAIACGALVANVYYAQTLIERIGPDLGMSAAVSGSIVTLTQLGYGLGLFFIVPLGDLFENRRLTLLLLTGTCIGTLAIGLTTNAASFMVASVLVGICATGAQILLPLATYLAPHDRQGTVIGQVMSGLLTGIMLARPLASYITGLFGWHAIFYLSAAVMVVIGLAILRYCPQRLPPGGHKYGALLRSTVTQLREHRRLRLRAAYQALMFAAFNLFWTVAPLELIDHFGFSQHELALFAIAGAGGALIAPQVGALADRGMEWRLTLAALTLATLLFLCGAPIVTSGGSVAFAAGAFVFDATVQANQITGQRIIFAISRDNRARVNAAYMTVIFIFGAGGSVLGTASYSAFGWPGATLVGAALTGAALMLFLFGDHGASSQNP